MSMPARLGRYVVRRRIGAGGFATVWLAYDEQLDSPVAVKVLADNWSEDAQVRRRFLEEGRYLRRVESPHVVSVYDAGELDDGRPYLVMSYADQGTLADRLGQAPEDATEPVAPLPLGQARTVIAQVARGLQDLHDHDVLHRDVKPANVLFRTGSAGHVRAMLGDLGLGKALDVSSRLTMVAGTPSYVAPEQARALPLDARADQYSLGALAYLLLTGRAPYQHASLSAAATPTPPEPPSGVRDDLPAALDGVLLRALAVERDERYPDVTAFARAVDAALGDLPGEPAQPLALAAVDPGATQAGRRPTLHPPGEDADDPTGGVGGRRRSGVRALAWGAAAAVLTVAAGTTAYAAREATGGPAVGDLVEVADTSSTLVLTVPSSWSWVARDGWRPPGSESRYPAVSAGTGADWQTAGGAGVVASVLPARALPPTLPQHPECARSELPVSDTIGGDVSQQVTWVGCPAGVTVERVVQVTSDRILWVQVRGRDRAQVLDVLDDVSTRGLG